MTSRGKCIQALCLACTFGMLGRGHHHHDGTNACTYLCRAQQAPSAAVVAHPQDHRERLRWRRRGFERGEVGILAVARLLRLGEQSLQSLHLLRRLTTTGGDGWVLRGVGCDKDRTCILDDDASDRDRQPMCQSQPQSILTFTARTPSRPAPAPQTRPANPSLTLTNSSSNLTASAHLPQNRTLTQLQL